MLASTYLSLSLSSLLSISSWAHGTLNSLFGSVVVMHGKLIGGAWTPEWPPAWPPAYWPPPPTPPYDCTLSKRHDKNEKGKRDRKPMLIKHSYGLNSNIGLLSCLSTRFGSVMNQHHFSVVLFWPFENEALLFWSIFFLFICWLQK